MGSSHGVTKSRTHLKDLARTQLPFHPEAEGVGDVELCWVTI